MNRVYPFKACIFDLDGTLVDSLPGISYAVDFAIAEVVPGLACKDLRSLIGPPIRQVFQSALCGAVSEAQLDSLEKSFRAVYDSEGWMKSRPYQGVEQTLRTLTTNGIATFILTNKPLHLANRILDSYDLAQHFRAVVGRESRRPAFSDKPQVADYLCQQFGLFGQTTLLIGDSEDDAKAAWQCGLSFAAADYGYGQVSTKLSNQSHYRLTSVSDLLTIKHYNLRTLTYEK
jgi:phosphoglycolate phosphatase